MALLTEARSLGFAACYLAITSGLASPQCCTVLSISRLLPPSAGSYPQCRQASVPLCPSSCSSLHPESPPFLSAPHLPHIHALQLRWTLPQAEQGNRSQSPGCMSVAPGPGVCWSPSGWCRPGTSSGVWLSTRVPLEQIREP